MTLTWRYALFSRSAPSLEMDEVIYGAWSEKMVRKDGTFLDDTKEDGI